MRLKTIEVAGFRSLDRTKIENLDQVNVFIGKNNSGKSTIFNVLRFLLKEDLGVSDYISNLTYHLLHSDIKVVLEFSLDFQDKVNLTHGIFNNDEALGNLAKSSFLDLIQLQWTYSRKQFESIECIVEMKILDARGQLKDVFKHHKPDSGPAMNWHLDLDRMLPLQPVTTLRDPVMTMQSDNSYFVNTRAVGKQRIVPTGCKSIDQLWGWVDGFLRKAYHFDTNRRSQRKMSIQENKVLNSDGSNLAMVLMTLRNNETHTYERIAHYVSKLIPDIGDMRTLIKNQDTETGFYQGFSNHTTDLYDMGGGIEQLLMVGTVLETTPLEASLFLEEPESHLHPGAQKYLLESLLSSGRQVFITTHSPVFIKEDPRIKLFQVKKHNNLGRVTEVNKTEELMDLMDELGLRNSDLFLSDGILFVEGPSDASIIQTFSETLHQSLFEKNIKILHLGGGSNIDAEARIRSETITTVLDKIKLPTLFVVDSDNRTARETQRLKDKHGQHLHLLEGREIENYLLDAEAIKAVLLQKASGQQALEIQKVTPDNINEKIDEITQGLYDQVLINQVKSEMGHLGDLIRRDDRSRFHPHASDGQLPQVLQTYIGQRLASLPRVEDVVEAQETHLKALWESPEARRRIAPGADVLDGVFHHFGFKYKKTQDGPALARAIPLEKVPQEIQRLIERTLKLTGR